MILILIDYSKAQKLSIPLFDAKKFQLNYLGRKLIIIRLPLFGKVVLEPSYNLEMNEGKLMSALERGRKP